MIPSVASLMVHLLFRIWRWQWLLKPLANIPFGPAYRAGMIGIGGNMVLPFRAGEFLRAYVIGRSCNISKTGAFATVVVERIFDGLTVVLFLILLITFGISEQTLQLLGLVMGVGFVVALSGLFLFVKKPEWFEAIILKVLPHAFAEKILGLMRGFASGLEILRDGKQLAMVSVLSIVAWVFVVFSFWPIFLAFEFHAPIPVFTPLLAVPMIAFGLTLPGAPGGLGIFHAATVFTITISYQIVGNPLPVEYEPIAAACSVMLHISQAVPEALIGAVCFFAEGLSLSDIEAGREIETGQEMGDIETKT